MNKYRNRVLVCFLPKKKVFVLYAKFSIFCIKMTNSSRSCDLDINNATSPHPHPPLGPTICIIHVTCTHTIKDIILKIKLAAEM